MTLLLRTTDPIVRRRAERVAAQFGLPVDGEGEPAGVLVELELDGAIAEVRSLRAEHPELTIVGFLSTSDPDLWREGERAGADEVTTRGRADRVLATHLDDRLSGRRRARRLRLAPLSDFAGRLGYVGRIDETPVGALALYNVAGRVWAVADACPHAGASLCEGELDGDVITCPRHGSQFRVTDGERLRGPADVALATYPIVVEAGDAFVELPE